MTVQNFMKIVWKVFEKFEIFMKRSGENKRHDWITTRKIFRTPKIEILTKNAKVFFPSQLFFFKSIFLFPTS